MMIREYIRKYKQTSGAVKIFIWTVVFMMALIIVTTIWAYARLEYARTNIHAVPLRPWKPTQTKTP